MLYMAHPSPTALIELEWRLAALPSMALAKATTCLPKHLDKLPVQRCFSAEEFGAT